MKASIAFRQKFCFHICGSGLVQYIDLLQFSIVKLKLYLLNKFENQVRTGRVYAVLQPMCLPVLTT